MSTRLRHNLLCDRARLAFILVALAAACGDKTANGSVDAGSDPGTATPGGTNGTGGANGATSTTGGDSNTGGNDTGNATGGDTTGGVGNGSSTGDSTTGGVSSGGTTGSTTAGTTGGGAGTTGGAGTSGTTGGSTTGSTGAGTTGGMSAGCGSNSLIPNPTRAALEAKGGPLAVATYHVPSPKGWAGGTVIYPTAAGQYPFVVAIAGGGRTTTDVTWVAELLASWGFVTVATEGTPVSTMPQPRAVQLTAMLDQIIELGKDSSTPLFGKLNGRYGVSGHSFGGGAALYALTDDDRWETGMAMAPWYRDEDSAARMIEEPTFIWTDTDDSAVTNDTDGYRYYGNLPGEKLHVEVVGGHFAFSTTMIDPWDPNFPYGWDEETRALQNLLTRAWFSYWMCDDDRFLTFLCGAEADADHPGQNSKVTMWQDSCDF